MCCIRFTPKNKLIYIRAQIQNFSRYFTSQISKWQFAISQKWKNRKICEKQHPGRSRSSTIQHADFMVVFCEYSAYLYTVNRFTAVWVCYTCAIRFIQTTSQWVWWLIYAGWHKHEHMAVCYMCTTCRRSNLKKNSLTQSTNAQTYLDIWIKIETYKSLVFYRLRLENIIKLSHHTR